MNTNATTLVGFAEPTLSSNATQAYSQCSAEPTLLSNATQAYSHCPAEPSYSYPSEPDYGYGSYYGQPAPIQQQPAPVAQSSSAGKALLVVAGLAVVGAAAFGGVYLMNSSHSQPQPAPTAAPAQSSTVNLPQIQLAAPAQNGPTSVPVIVNNPAPVERVSGPSVAPRSITAQSPISAPQQIAAPVQALAPAAAPGPAPAPAPDPAPEQPNGPGVSIQTPLAGVNVGSQGGVNVNAPGVSVGTPDQNGGDVKVSVGSNTGDDKTATTATDGTTKGNTTANAGEKGGEAQNNNAQDQK